MSEALDKIAKMKADLAAAEAEAAAEISEQKQGVMAELLAHMKDHQITVPELIVFARSSNSKYSDGKNTWSGKGKKPQWIVAAVAAGTPIANFLTVKPE